jgi:regulatory protein
LLDKGYPADAVAAAVGRVAALGYLDDVRFATLMSESSFRNKGWGPSRIERALLRRGIDPETAAAAVASYRDVETEASRATEVLRRRVRNAGEIGDASALRRSRQYLLRRGFSPGAVTAALRELKREVLA